MIRIAAPFETLVEDWREVYNSGTLSEGEYVKLFEKEVECNYSSEFRATAFNSCGAALLSVAQYLYQVAECRRALVCSNTFFATGEAFRQAGFKVEYTDCGKEDFCMTLKTLEDAVSQVGKPDVVVLTHIGGGIARDYEAIATFCEGNGIHLVEDAAHAMGATSPSGHRAGELSLAACFSFYPTKAIPVGEGGAVITDNPVLRYFVSIFRNYGKYKDAGGIIRYQGTGMNLRMDEWTAVVAYRQLQKLPEIIEARREAAEHLKGVISPMVDLGPGAVWYKYIVPATAHTGGLPLTGKVYREEDQLVQSLGEDGTSRRLLNCDWVARNHKCISIEHVMAMAGGDVSKS